MLLVTLSHSFCQKRGSCSPFTLSGSIQELIKVIILTQHGHMVTFREGWTGWTAVRTSPTGLWSNQLPSGQTKQPGPVAPQDRSQSWLPQKAGNQDQLQSMVLAARAQRPGPDRTFKHYTPQWKSQRKRKGRPCKEEAAKKRRIAEDDKLKEVPVSPEIPASSAKGKIKNTQAQAQRTN